MIRNAQVSHVEDENFSDTRITNLYGLHLSPATNSGISYGELRRLATGEVIYRHPVAGIVIILDSSGNLAGGGGSDSFLQVSLSAVTDITINHTFGRRASVSIIEGEYEIEAEISYPTGFENSQVRIRSNQAITGYAILT